MTTIGVQDAETRLPHFLDRAAHGEEFLIQRDGEPLAVLGPPPAHDKPSPREAVAALKAFSRQQGRTLGGITFRDLIGEGRRD